MTPDLQPLTNQTTEVETLTVIRWYLECLSVSLAFDPALNIHIV